MRHRTRRILALGAHLTALQGLACGGREDPAARASLEEATLTAEVRSRLLMVEGLRSLPLTVETDGGTVTIRGSVADTTQPAAIRALAGRVRGVERVELDVRVVPPADSTAGGSAAGDSPNAGRAPPATHQPRDTTPAARPGPLPSLDEAG
jgi:hypothetical protein